MTSRRDLIKAGAMAAVAGAVSSSVTLADPVPEQHKHAAGHLLARWRSPGWSTDRKQSTSAVTTTVNSLLSNAPPFLPFFCIGP